MDTSIKPRKTPYLIAEIGMNHEGSLSKAIEMIRQVASAGWHAAKFQTYTADRLASATASPAYWDTSLETETSQHELFQRWKPFSAKDYKTLEIACGEVGIDFLSTPFSIEDYELLPKSMKYIKIASADITNVPLLEFLGSRRKPLLLSTGAANDQEIQESMGILRKAGATDITLLHCILNYPTEVSDANLWRISDLMDKFPETKIGYSDHTKYRETSVLDACSVAWLLGAEVIEKHFTWDRTLKGNDHYHAADSLGLERISTFIREAAAYIGPGEKSLLEIQEVARNNARRRIFLKNEIKKGAIICAKDLIALRASHGIEISRWHEVVGKLAVKDQKAEEPLLAPW